MTTITIDQLDYDKELCSIYNKDDNPPDNGDRLELDEAWGISLGNEMLLNN